MTLPSGAWIIIITPTLRVVRRVVVMRMRNRIPSLHDYSPNRAVHCSAVQCVPEDEDVRGKLFASSSLSGARNCRRGSCSSESEVAVVALAAEPLLMLLVVVVPTTVDVRLNIMSEVHIIIIIIHCTRSQRQRTTSEIQQSRGLHGEELLNGQGRRPACDPSHPQHSERCRPECSAVLFSAQCSVLCCALGEPELVLLVRLG